MKSKSFLVVFSPFKRLFAKAAFVMATLLLLLVSFTSHVYAAMPTLSLTVESPGYTQISVNGDPNSAVSLFSYSSIAGSQSQNIGVLGTTNNFGYFSETLNDQNYNIPYETPVYVTVDGQNSTTASWPINTLNNNSGGTGIGTASNLSLSQTSVTLEVGQTISITAYNTTNNYYNYSSSLIISNNSNPSAISATVGGSNTINITGTNYGSATITVCESNQSAYQNTCGTIYATVPSPVNTTSSYSYPYPSYTYPQQNAEPIVVPEPIIYSIPLSFSSNGVTMNAGTSQTIQIYGSGSYYIYQNSNPVVATISLNGNWLSIYGIQAGTSNVTVCENNTNSSCATLSVDIIANQVVQTYYYYPSYPQPAPIIYPVQEPITYSPWRWR